MLELTVRIGFSLLVVLALMWGLAKLARRPLAGRTGGALAVLARQQLTKGATVAVVKVVDRALILGVTDGRVTLLGEADLAALETPQTTGVRREAVALEPAADPVPAGMAGPAAGRLAGSALSPQTWAQTVSFLRDRTVRR
jgi:flagellar protein FliO/FliZ